MENEMCILIFSTTFILNISYPKKNSARYYHKFKNAFMKSTRYSCRNFMKLEFYQQTFYKSLNIKFHQNLSSESRSVLCGWKDGRT